MKQLLWRALAGAALTFSCADSGQTGSPSCAPGPLSCECDSLAGKSLVKATVLAIDIGSVSLEIEEVLNPSPLLDERDIHGEVEGPLAGSLACDRNAVAPPRVGDVVFAAFLSYSRPEPNALRNVGEVVVSTWSDPVDVGNRRPISVSQALALTDPMTCEQQYPRPAMQPCNDTRTVGDCSVNGLQPGRSGASWWPLLALLGMVATIARRSRRRGGDHRKRA